MECENGNLFYVFKQTFVVSVELPDFNAEVEGSVSSCVIEGKCCNEILSFFARVHEIKYLNKPEENKTDATNYLHTRRLRRTQY